VLQRCGCRRASLGGLPLVGPVDGDRLDECLVVGLVLAGGDGSRLEVSFRGEFWRPYVGHPDLNGPETLSAQALAMFAYPFACTSHVPMLHVTEAGCQPRLVRRIGHMRKATSAPSLRAAFGF